MPIENTCNKKSLTDEELPYIEVPEYHESDEPGYVYKDEE